jgi:hypothetical protein
MEHDGLGPPRRLVQSFDRLARLGPRRVPFRRRHDADGRIALPLWLFKGLNPQHDSQIEAEGADLVELQLTGAKGILRTEALGKLREEQVQKDSAKPPAVR